ncbi:reverse transcriptase domain-containing protein [Tanacetum coccineum]
MVLFGRVIYIVSTTFNVAYLSPYKGDSDDELDSGSSLFQEGKDDADAVNKRVNVTNTLGAYFSAINFGGRLEPASPARDPRDVETIEKLQQRIQELEYVNRLYQPRHNDHAVDRDDRYRDDPIRSRRLKIKIPKFTGKVHPDDFIDWLSKVERVFDVRDIPDKLKVETWEKMKKLMKAKFLPKNHLKEEEQVVAQFLGVLKPVIADIIKAKSRGSTSHFTSRFTPPTRTAPPTTPKTTTPTTLATYNTRERVDNAPRCYKCGGLGHYARDCPNLKTLAFVPDDAGPIYDTNAEPELDEPSDELVYPDRGEALVIQRVLNVTVSKLVDDNSWLRNNIFRTKCTSKGNL